MIELPYFQNPSRNQLKTRSIISLTFLCILQYYTFDTLNTNRQILSQTILYIIVCNVIVIYILKALCMFLRNKLKFANYSTGRQSDIIKSTIIIPIQNILEQVYPNIHLSSQTTTHSKLYKDFDQPRSTLSVQNSYYVLTCVGSPMVTEGDSVPIQHFNIPFGKSFVVSFSDSCQPGFVLH